MELERWSSGPRPFLGLHGWGGDRNTFAPLKPYLPPEVSFWSADLPGYGASPAPAKWTEDALVAPVLAAIARVRAEAGTPPTLVGNCSGAILAAMASQVDETAVARLVLIDAFAWVPWYFRVFTWGEFGRRAYRTTFESPIGRRVTNTALAGKRREDTDLTATFVRVSADTALGHLRVLSQAGGPERFAGLGLPINLAYGEKTFAAVRAAVARWQAVWPQARATEIRGAGHLPILEGSEAVAGLTFGAGEER